MKREHLLSIILATTVLAATTEATRVYFGTSKSKGIYFAELNPDKGTLTKPQLAVETDGCGFIAIHPNHRFLYSTGTSAFKINDDGTLTALNTQTTQGGGACHISIDKTGQCVLVAYYGGGAVASFRILDDGSLSEATSFHEHEGSGEHPQRQKKPYAHSVFTNPENTHVYAADLGIDKVMIYKLDPASGTLSPNGDAVVPGGSMGPRHMKWSADGKVAYVLNELDLSVALFKPGKAAGSLEFIKTVSTLPADADKERMSCAEIRIHPNGSFIYASNRDLEKTGRDSITVFSQFEDGFQRLATIPAEVWVPRNFNIDPTGKWMLVGGQKSQDIAVFSVDSKTGLIKFTGTKVPFEGGPICIEFLD